MRNWLNHLPIKLAAIPVGAKSNTFGLNGWSPCICKINSENWAINEMRKLFPTPPPPKKENSMHVEHSDKYYISYQLSIDILAILPWAMILGGSGSICPPRLSIATHWQ